MYLAVLGWLAGHSPAQSEIFYDNQLGPLRAGKRTEHWGGGKRDGRGGVSIINNEDLKMNCSPSQSTAVNIPTHAHTPPHHYIVEGIVPFLREETVHVCCQLVLRERSRQEIITTR